MLESAQKTVQYSVRKMLPSDSEMGVFFEPKRESFVVEDRDGNPVMYVMATKVERLDILFDPQASALRTARGLLALNEFMGKRDAKQLIFDSKAKALIDSMERLGFKRDEDTYVKEL